MAQIAPFLQIEELNAQLVPAGPNRLRRVDGQKVDSLPGQPRVQLSDSIALSEQLTTDLLVPELDYLAPKLWLVASPRSSAISPLHHQAVRGRALVLTQSPRLHLVWYYDRIFIKPLPRYLLSHAFWQYLLAQDRELHKAAYGFMRTYSYLVRSETDFDIAFEKKLIPRDSFGGAPMTWETFARLISSFDRLEDRAVCPRYHFGELRLSRLNFFATIFLGKLSFHRINAQWGTLLSSFLAPFVVIFGLVTVALNAMQVGLAAQAGLDVDSRWAAFQHISQWAAVSVLIMAAFVTFLVFAVIATMLLHDLSFTWRIIRAKRRHPEDSYWRKYKSAVV